MIQQGEEVINSNKKYSKKMEDTTHHNIEIQKKHRFFFEIHDVYIRHHHLVLFDTCLLV